MWNTPKFWWKEEGVLGLILAPLGFIYGQIVESRMKGKTAPKVNCPVICIGNLTVGGSGKTPLVLELVRRARLLGIIPGVVLRGYGGSFKKTHFVDKKTDSAREVGDEALLIAEECLVAIGVDRYKSAKLLCKKGCELILMDDGFQSNRLFFDYALLAFDSFYGIGNRRIFPAGPLRAPLKSQLDRSDQLVLLGQGTQQRQIEKFKSERIKTITKGYPKTRCILNFEQGKRSNNLDFWNYPLIAFSGIGHPQKFYQGIKLLGGEIICEKNYPDHYFLKKKDFQELETLAYKHSAVLATTYKDYVRLKHSICLKKLDRFFVFDLSIELENPLLLDCWILEARRRYSVRSQRKTLFSAK